MRVGCAQGLASLGFDAWLIAILLRHSSNAVFGYIRDAPLISLKSAAVKAAQSLRNAATPGGNRPLGQGPPSAKSSGSGSSRDHEGAARPPMDAPRVNDLINERWNSHKHELMNDESLLEPAFPIFESLATLTVTQLMGMRQEPCPKNPEPSELFTELVIAMQDHEERLKGLGTHYVTNLTTKAAF